MKNGAMIAAGVAAAALTLAVSASPALAAEEIGNYKLESASVSVTSSQAGAHPDATIAFALSEKGGQPYAQTENIEIALPPGVIGNPQAVESCSVADLGNTIFESACPAASQVGLVQITVGDPLNGTFIEPIYNMQPPHSGDIVARLGLFAGKWPAFVNFRVDPIDYHVIATVEGAPSAASVISASATVWGVPASPIHNGDRLTPEEAFKGEKPAGGLAVEVAELPFFTNPTDCTLQRQLKISVRSYQGPEDSKSAEYPPVGGCGKLSFEPTFTIAPTNSEAFAPTGIDADLTIPQDENPNSRATSALKSAVVSLPPGFSINPAAADGQQACDAAEVGYGENKPSACPNAAKLGSVEVDVPALEEVLRGSVYLRNPEPGHLFRFWVVTDEQGVHLKLPAEIDLDPVTGQIKTVFSGISSLGGLPQVPFSALRLHISGGPRAPLATPGCGTYQTTFSFAPWSGNPATEGQTPMRITTGCGKGGFMPNLSAGTLSPAAGQFSSFAMTLTRSDGELNPRTITVHLPQGMLAKLGGVPLCADAQAASGTCPAASRIGSLTASAGVGGAPLWIPQPGKAPTAVYLAGPYRGAPYSIVSVVPAQAGPFDLGTVVNRAAIFIDPETSLARIETDPLPQILEGVPISYRTVHVDIDRNEFTINPTSCARKQIRATVTAVDGKIAEPTSPFQATECAKLAYRPKIKLRLRGSTKRTGHPALETVITQASHQANNKSISLILPASEFIDQAHISNPCTRVQFNAGTCPKASILGTVEARTPLLNTPLKGKLYFRSNGGERELPDIVADVQGAGIHITQVGFVDSVQKKGTEISRIRTRFRSFPDAPVSKIAVKLFGGKRGLLVNSRNLCAAKRRAAVEFQGQNGRSQVTNPVIATNCRKSRR